MFFLPGATFKMFFCCNPLLAQNWDHVMPTFFSSSKRLRMTVGKKDLQKLRSRNQDIAVLAFSSIECKQFAVRISAAKFKVGWKGREM